jgi:hypothetical protein
MELKCASKKSQSSPRNSSALDVTTLQTFRSRFDEWFLSPSQPVWIGMNDQDCMFWNELGKNATQRDNTHD